MNYILLSKLLKDNSQTISTNNTIIRDILKNKTILSPILHRFNYKDKYLALVYLYEILIRKKYNLYKKALKNRILEVKDIKYIRINTLRVRIDTCYNCKNNISDNYNSIRINLTEILNTISFFYTPFPFIFVLNQPIDSQIQKYIKLGWIFVQDISSALPALLFNTEKDKRLSAKMGNNRCICYGGTDNIDDNTPPTILDCCAAPGNKTTQLSMLYSCNLTSIEKDPLRYKTLLKFISKTDNEKEIKKHKYNTLNIDFLSYTQPTEYILLDPSCTGSGIHKIYDKDDKRISSLNKLQIKLLQHAISLNPKRIIYSTCSMHKEENEEVIKEIIEKNNKYKLISVIEEIKESIKRYQNNKYKDKDKDKGSINKDKDNNINIDKGSINNNNINNNIDNTNNNNNNNNNNNTYNNTIDNNTYNNNIEEYIKDNILSLENILCFGREEYNFYNKVLRVKNNISNGFFIAILERID